MTIHYVNLNEQWRSEKNDLLPIIEKVLNSGKYVNSSDITLFEEKFQIFVMQNMP